MLTPFASQLKGASFLADRPAALLADEPRVGKTGAAIIAADYIFARRILIVTTASGRPVWVRGFKDWSGYGRSVQAVYDRDTRPKTDVVIVSWAGVAEQKLFGWLVVQEWDLLILDESHYAKNPAAKRTVAVYGSAAHPTAPSLSSRAAVTWCLTGTPVPNAPNDLHPMLRALCPGRIDGMGYDAFVSRYCVVVPRNIGGRMIDVVKGGKNEAELAEKLRGFFLRRTQQDVGITEPVYEVFPLHSDNPELKKLPIYETFPLHGANPGRYAVEATDARRILAAAETGDTRQLDIHLGPLRRLTGVLKAMAVVEAVKEELDNGLDKIVLMAWHTDVIEVLFDGLKERYEPCIVHGGTSPGVRMLAEETFRLDPACRVFIGQMQAAGEAIDLSAAAELIFVEMSSVPKDMKQAALRVTNYGQRRQPRVRVAALEGSIDEALADILTRKVASIKAVLED